MGIGSERVCLERRAAGLVRVHPRGSPFNVTLCPPFTAVTGPIIGIDLGTTYSCVGIYRDGRVDIVPNDQGNRITPSYVAWDESERLIGDAAKNQATINPAETVFDVKRLIGRNFQDPTVQADMKMWCVVRAAEAGGAPFPPPPCVLSCLPPAPPFFCPPPLPRFPRRRQLLQALQGCEQG